MKLYSSTLIIILFAMFALLESCDSPSQDADQIMAQQTEQALSEANRQIGMPAIVNYQERKLAKQIFELRDQENLVTYAYITSYTGKLVFLGKAIGYGLPYSVQYTNPERLDRILYNGGGALVLPQADPNGLFMPQGLSATWLQLIDPDSGEPRVVYIEQEIIVSPFKLH